MRRRQHSDRFEHRAGLADRATRQQLPQSHGIHLVVDDAAGEHRLQLGGEQDVPSELGIKQRLDAELVARKQQPFPATAAAAIQDRQREHATQSA